MLSPSDTIRHALTIAIMNQEKGMNGGTVSALYAMIGEGAGKESADRFSGLLTGRDGTHNLFFAVSAVEQDPDSPPGQMQLRKGVMNWVETGE